MVANFVKKGNREFFSRELLFKTVGIIFVLIVVVLIVVDFKIYKKKRELISQVGLYEKQIEDIKKSSQTLKEEIANADNTDYLEKIGYEQFGQTRPGETEYMFVGSSKKDVSAVTNQDDILSVKSWSARLSGAWQWIKSKF